ncbi:hypothetical protein [Chitinophaga flava]|uniref:Uncharacterized protein n=1 Tax=Chitinophaga flava TaxID=2259036 RepID=A0A365XUU2_9BACT|nr:hypothetical protein [Chitinophaga flava]RBL89791.1 hypothetical protein DF182_25215 [Chitinophaga flava]
MSYIPVSRVLRVSGAGKIIFLQTRGGIGHIKRQIGKIGAFSGNINKITLSLLTGIMKYADLQLYLPLLLLKEE